MRMEMSQTNWEGMSALVELTGFWQERYKASEKDEADMAKAGFLYLTQNEMAQRYAKISLNVLQYMPNLKELSVIIDNVTDWGYIAKLENLHTLTIKADIDDELAAAIAGLPKLKELRLTRCNLSDAAADRLAEGKITKLGINKVTGFGTQSLAKFKRLTCLDIGETDVDYIDSIAELVNLRELTIYRAYAPYAYIKNLRFLKKLKKLESFICEKRLGDDADLADILASLPKLRNFEYPISDLALVKLCPKLEKVTLDGKGCVNYEALRDTKIVSIMVCDACSEADAKAIIDKAKEQVPLRSYSFNGPWAKRGIHDR